ncbi:MULTISPECIES: hypothetical protein [Helcobacillus]|uniref:DNA-directed RNA polymerase subunit beta n=1 Tax=Helcobacillus massiliensis TaxID=521392 RepID=A0A839R0P3_9MICO|nr:MULTISPECIES: hypothetical protein [Helcobacillus]MBB3023347.1 hypothetical protein [Helcobacillus massiliensis]MCG7426719.1 hypothetical protein [Helcobacillus sp. ACRRO]MDK7742420.1 hypothetical protein [Helcobacillus massiliensis]WOO92493.1 hypothetical protein R3I40_08730 [Helcobacillus massiliensis]
MAQFRRPASLTPAQQEQIEGGTDPALKDQIAHDSAAALLRETRGTVDPSAVERILRLAESEGLDDMAALWSGAPAVSLPGALWRLYVLHTWVQQQTAEVRRRYQIGTQSAPGLRYRSGIANPPDLDDMRRTLDEILRGAFTGDLSMALLRASAVAMLSAYGTAHLADAPGSGADDPSADGAGRITMQADRLHRLGEDLEAAGRAAAGGSLF